MSESIIQSPIVQFALLLLFTLLVLAIGYFLARARASLKLAQSLQMNAALDKQLALLQQRHESLQQQLDAEKKQLLQCEASLNKLADIDKKQQQLLAVARAEKLNYLEGQHQLKQQLTVADEKFSGLQFKYEQLLASQQQLETSLLERDKSHQEQLAQFEQQKQQLSQEFENLANKVFDKKQEQFTQTTQTSLDTLLMPFREQIEGFQKRVNDVHSDTVKGQATLASEIKKVMDVGLQMQAEATNLSSALKGDSQKRGAWGEAQLQRTLELSGLVEDAHYEKQTSFKDAQGKIKQTDFLIKLPDAKHIIIDSKVTLNAYDQSLSANTDEAVQVALDHHAQAVKNHIDDLASKDYTNVIGVFSPNFVLMFMPIEPAYIEALKYTKRDLFAYAYEKNIILVSHTTLIPILRTVANLWMLDSSNREAREISEKAGDIYNQVCMVAERLSKLGNTLTSASNHYNSTVKALVGQQGLHGKVERFSQLSNKVSKSMPTLQPLNLDVDSHRLDLIVEEIRLEEAVDSKEL